MLAVADHLEACSSEIAAVATRQAAVTAATRGARARSIAAICRTDRRGEGADGEIKCFPG